MSFFIFLEEVTNDELALGDSITLLIDSFLDRSVSVAVKKK